MSFQYLSAIIFPATAYDWLWTILVVGFLLIVLWDGDTD